MVEVRILRRVQSGDNGGLLHPGETASFPAGEADRLIRLGAAEWASGPVREDAAGLPVEYVEEVLVASEGGGEKDSPIHAREVEAPPRDKMVDKRRAKTK